MAAIGYAQLPVPAGGDAPVGPGAFAALAAALDPHLVQLVADLADRNNTLSAAPRRTVAVANDGTTWVKTATTNSWVTIWEPMPAWRTLTLASGYVAGEYTPQILKYNGRCWLRGRIQKTDGSVIATNGVKLADVPSDCRPLVLGSFAGGASYTGDPITGVGRVEVYGASSSTVLGGVGIVAWLSQDGTGTPWVDISGSYWLT